MHRLQAKNKYDQLIIYGIYERLQPFEPKSLIFVDKFSITTTLKPTAEALARKIYNEPQS